MWADIPRAIEDRQSKALSQLPEDSEQGLSFIRCVFSSVLQLQTMDTEVQTDSMLDSM